MRAPRSKIRIISKKNPTLANQSPSLTKTDTRFPSHTWAPKHPFDFTGASGRAAHHMGLEYFTPFVKPGLP